MVRPSVDALLLSFTEKLLRVWHRLPRVVRRPLAWLILRHRQ